MTRRLRRWLVPVVVVLATLSTGAPLQSATAAETLDTDSVLVEIDLQADGDAVWRVEYRYVLDDGDAARSFEDLRDRIEANRSRYAGRFAERMRQSVTAAENDTGRSMSLADASVTTGRQTVPQESERGIVTYEFTWRDFAVANATHVRAGDAIHGFYVSPKTTLVVTWPDNYEPAAPLLPDPDEQSTGRAVWEGETAFASDEPTIAVAAAGVVDDATAGTAAASGGGPARGDGLPLGLLVVGVVALGGAGVGGAVAMRRRTDDAAGADETGDGTAGTDGDEQSVPPELMSNEERVRAALDDHGGRMKQQELAEACDWHPSKTSKVVNDLKEEGAIDVFRLGRENIVSLPEEDDHDE